MNIMNKRTLIVIPAYNEAENIERVIKDIKDNAPDVDYVIINDGSTDNTKEIVEKNHFNCINGFINLGLFGAVQTGFLYALENNYDVVFQFDGDGQHDAKYIKTMLNEIQSDDDIIIGSRFVTERKPFTARMLGSRLISFAIRIATGKKIVDPTSGLRAYGKNSIKDYATDMNNPPEPDTIVYMLRKKRNVKEVQVEMREREFGESYLNLPNTIKYMSRMIVSILLIQPFRKIR